MRRIFLIFFIIFTLSVSSAYPFWIWTPKTRKWVNPKNVAKDSPKAQFEYALTFYNEKELGDALREFKKLLKEYQVF